MYGRPKDAEDESTPHFFATLRRHGVNSPQGEDSPSGTAAPPGARTGPCSWALGHNPHLPGALLIPPPFRPTPRHGATPRLWCGSEGRGGRGGRGERHVPRSALPRFGAGASPPVAAPGNPGPASAHAARRAPRTARDSGYGPKCLALGPQTSSTPRTAPAGTAGLQVNGHSLGTAVTLRGRRPHRRVSPVCGKLRGSCRFVGTLRCHSWIGPPECGISLNAAW